MGEDEEAEPKHRRARLKDGVRVKTMLGRGGATMTMCEGTTGAKHYGRAFLTRIAVPLRRRAVHSDALRGFERAGVRHVNIRAACQEKPAVTHSNIHQAIGVMM